MTSPFPFSPDPECRLCESKSSFRREFLDRSRRAMGALALLGSPLFLTRRAAAAKPSGSGSDTLVYVFLRGGMDGLSFVAPYGDPDYYVLRPTLSLPPPGSGGNGALTDLDGFFGLTPVASPLLTPWTDGALAFVQAAGSTNDSRSHFDAMKFMEFGDPDSGISSKQKGWLSRYLEGVGGGGETLRGMAVDYTLPYALFEAPETIPVWDPTNFPFPGDQNTAALRRQKIENMYDIASDPLYTAGRSGLAAIDMLDLIDFENYSEENGADYGESTIGKNLRSIAAMIKADAGIETFSVDVDGWDTLDTQGNLDGTFAGLMNGLATGMEAFYLDMQARLDSVTLVVVTEFGRTGSENGSSGTDHGRASCMMVMGGNVNGGQVVHNWPGLAQDKLDLGDLAVTIDYRDVMWEILSKRMGGGALDSVFPGHTFSDHNILS